jgi:hypothetical protein
LIAGHPSSKQARTVQLPVSGSQTDILQKSVVGHVVIVPPVHWPLLHASPTLQALSSLQATASGLFATCMQTMQRQALCVRRAEMHAQLHIYVC